MERFKAYCDYESSEGSYLEVFDNDTTEEGMLWFSSEEKYKEFPNQNLLSLTDTLRLYKALGKHLEDHYMLPREGYENLQGASELNESCRKVLEGTIDTSSKNESYVLYNGDTGEVRRVEQDITERLEEELARAYKIIDRLLEED